MEQVTIIGTIAAFFTTLSFIPQAVKTIRTRNTSGISLVMYSLFAFGTFMWCMFGIVSNSLPIIIANAITLVFACIILYYKMRYK